MGLKEENQPENTVDTWPGHEYHVSGRSKGILREAMVGGISLSHVFTLI